METTLRTMPCRSCYCLHQFYFFNSSVLLNFLCVRHFSEMHLTTAFYFMLFTIRLFIIYLASIILLLLIVIEKRREKVYLSLTLPSRKQNIVALNNNKKKEKDRRSSEDYHKELYYLKKKKRRKIEALNIYREIRQQDLIYLIPSRLSSSKLKTPS